MAVVIETTIGDIIIDLLVDKRPNTCKNFLKLCKVKYYNFCLFHSIRTDFIAQTGDPTGTGNGGESVFGLINGPTSRFYKGEKLPRLRHDKPGLVSMVNSGDNMVGSQFFITLGGQLNSLDEHIIFAEVTEGFDVLLKLNEVICDKDHRPYQDVRITHTVILDDPFDDLPGLIVPDRSPSPTKDVLSSSRIGADEVIDEKAGYSTKELEELEAQKEAAAQATILEIVGDIPDKDIAPPENVLFVCKLNPVTTEEDLDIIFGRFGCIKSCEVIRDKVSGDSLQYAFIEFAEQKSCEDAYLKMDNVLIDDRRIHVDFSQSVAKIRWKGKGRIEYLDKEERKSSLNNNKNKFRNNADQRENYKYEKNRNISGRYIRSGSKEDKHRRRRRPESDDRFNKRKNPQNKSEKIKSRDGLISRDKEKHRKHTTHSSKHKKRNATSSSDSERDVKKYKDKKSHKSKKHEHRK